MPLTPGGFLSRRPSLVPALVLVCQNTAIFFGHYFLGTGIPWDFWSDYYPRTAFWIHVAQAGVLPSWNPFQSMGYPFLLNLQTGLYYPPNWAFVAFDTPYTIEWAAILHGLHVLLGAFGMYAWLGVFFPRALALVGATAFQFFGGFYSNAEHVDIVRAFALLPWLFWSATTHDDGSLPGPVFGLPALVFLLATGGYPGNLIASLWVVPLYALLRVAIAGPVCPAGRPRYRALLVVAGLFLVGLAMAFVHLAPAAIYRDELTRTEQAAALRRLGVSLPHLLSLYTSNRHLAGEPSMSSTFITLPLKRSS